MGNRRKPTGSERAGAGPSPVPRLARAFAAEMSAANRLALYEALQLACLPGSGYRVDGVTFEAHLCGPAKDRFGILIH